MKRAVVRRVVLSVVIFSAVLSVRQERVLTAPGAGQGQPELMIQAGHFAPVNTLAFSPDGKLLATASDDETIKLWEVASGRLLRTIEAHDKEVTCACFSPDGKLLASASYDGAVKLWEVSSGERLRTLEGHSHFVYSVSFSPDGQTLASGSADQTVKLWETRTGKLILTMTGHSDMVTSVAFSRDGKTLASGSWDKTIKLWDPSSGENIKTLRGHLKWVNRVAFSPDGKTLASASSDDTIKLWDAASGKNTHTIKNNFVRSISFSPDGKVLAASSIKIELWDAATGNRIKTLEKKAYSTTPITAIAFSPDGQTLASASGEEGEEDTMALELWEVSSGKSFRTLGGHSDWVQSLSISPDGKLLGSSSWSRIKLWDASSGELLRVLEGHQNRINNISFSPDGKTLASAGGYNDDNINLWEVSSGKLLRTLKGHSYDATSVAFSPDGKTLASGSNNGEIKLWEVASGKLLNTLKGLSMFESVNSIGFSPDGKILASAGKGAITLEGAGSIRLWEVASGKPIMKIKGDSLEVLSVCFSPDGKILASAGFEYSIKLWEVSSGKLLQTLTGHSSEVNFITFRADGKILASGSKDNSIKIWETASGKLLTTLEGHSSSVTSVSFSPDGKTLVSASGGQIGFWDHRAGQLRCWLLPLDKEDWVVVDSAGYFDSSPNGKNLIGWTIGDQIYSFAQFFDEFYRPGLFSLVVSGREMEKKDRDLRQGILPPPAVAIISPEPGREIDSESVEVVVQVMDLGGGVQDIRIYHQGKLAAGAKEKQRTSPGSSVTRKFSIKLLDGENTLRATAYSSENIEATAYELKIRSAKKAVKPNLFLLAIGINRYQNRKYNLDWSRADAEGVASFFRAQKGKLYEEVYVTTLFDEQATRPAILEALKLPARENDVVVIYFAGHGVADGGVYYFLPHEIPMISPETVQQGGVAQSEIIAAISGENQKARKIVLLLDSCYSGALVEGLRVRGVDEEWAVRLLSKTAGVHVLAAAKDSQKAAELGKLGHGLFTYAMLEALSGKADVNNDKLIRVSEMLSFVTNEVTTLAAEVNHQQYPTMDMHGDDFPIAIK